MSDREQAGQVADEIIADARREDAKRRAGRLHFFHGGIFTRKEIERIGADKSVLDAALYYANKQWQLRASALVFLLLIGGAVALGVEPALTFFFLVSGLLALRSLTRKFALQFIEEQSATAEQDGLTPPPHF